MADRKESRISTVSPLFNKMDAFLARHRSPTSQDIPVLTEEAPAAPPVAIPVLTNTVQDSELMFDPSDFYNVPRENKAPPPPRLETKPAAPKPVVEQPVFLDLPILDLNGLDSPQHISPDPFDLEIDEPQAEKPAPTPAPAKPMAPVAPATISRQAVPGLKTAPPPIAPVRKSQTPEFTSYLHTPAKPFPAEVLPAPIVSEDAPYLPPSTFAAEPATIIPPEFLHSLDIPEIVLPEETASPAHPEEEVIELVSLEPMEPEFEEKAVEVTPEEEEIFTLGLDEEDETAIEIIPIDAQGFEETHPDVALTADEEAFLQAEIHAPPFSPPIEETPSETLHLAEEVADADDEFILTLAEEVPVPADTQQAPQGLATKADVPPQWVHEAQAANQFSDLQLVDEVSESPLSAPVSSAVLAPTLASAVPSTLSIVTQEPATEPEEEFAFELSLSESPEDLRSFLTLEVEPEEENIPLPVLDLALEEPPATQTTVATAPVRPEITETVIPEVSSPVVATPAAVTPAAVTPAAVTPVAVTPVAVTPVAVTPVAVTPAAVTPAAVTPAAVTPIAVTPPAVTSVIATLETAPLASAEAAPEVSEVDIPVLLTPIEETLEAHAQPYTIVQQQPIEPETADTDIGPVLEEIQALAAETSGVAKLGDAVVDEITAVVAAQIAVDISTEVGQLARQHFATMMKSFYATALQKLSDDISRDMEERLATRINALVREELQRQGLMD